MGQWIAIVIFVGHQFGTFTSRGSDFLRDILLISQKVLTIIRGPSGPFDCKVAASEWSISYEDPHKTHCDPPSNAESHCFWSVSWCCERPESGCETNVGGSKASDKCASY